MALAILTVLRARCAVTIALAVTGCIMLIVVASQRHAILTFTTSFASMLRALFIARRAPSPCDAASMAVPIFRIASSLAAPIRTTVLASTAKVAVFLTFVFANAGAGVA
jgi:hypothetical protein